MAKKNYSGNDIGEYPMTIAEKVVVPSGRRLLSDVLQDLEGRKLDAPQNEGSVGQVPQLAENGKLDWVTPLAGSTPDSTMSDSSTNAIQNKIVKKYVDDLGDEVSALGHKVGDGFAQVSVYFPEWEIGNLSISGSGWSYGTSTSRVRLKQGTTLHLYPGDVLGLSNYTGKVYYIGWQKLDGTYSYYNGWRSEDFLVSEEGDYVLVMRYNPETTVSQASDLSQFFFVRSMRSRLEKVENLNQIASAVIVGKNVVTLLNGSPGNAGNANAVCNDAIIDITSAKTITLAISRPNKSGYRYKYSFALYDTAEGKSRPVDSRVVRQVQNVYNPTITIQPGEKGLAFTLWEELITTANTYNPLRVGDFESETIGVLFNRGIFYDLQQAADWVHNAAVRYQDKLGALCSACRLNFSGSVAKDLQFLLVSDVHGDTIAAQNAAAIAPAFNTIDALMCLGDVNPARYGESFQSLWPSLMLSMGKPFYMCLGNHDVGNSKYIGHCATHQQEYDTFIKPVVDGGYLTSGEYTSGLSYYYHDFSARKIRLIVLNEFDEPLGAGSFNETYWEAISYNSGYSDIAVSTSYSAGDKVNVPGYTEYSFEAVQAVTTPSSFYTTQEKFPSYKIERGYRVIRQTQAQWFLNTLASTPANYGVVVALHQPISSSSQNQKDLKFAQDINEVGSSFLHNCMETDFIADAINAFVGGASYNANVVMKGDASYLNTQGGGTYAYNVSKDFSAKNTGVKFICYLGGHSHRDLIWKHNTYTQYQISPICATTHAGNNYGNDIKREVSESFGDGFGVDSLTAISFDTSQKVRLVKIGSDVTTEMTLRDQELIDLTN